MDPCPERDSISKFRKANHNGAKYAKQYVLEEIVVPGSDTPRTVLRRWENSAIGRIFVSREQVFHCIDEWHRALLRDLPCLHEEESDHSTSKGQQKTN